MSKLLTVFGATGLQGGSLLRYLLKRADVLKIYRLRGVTRNTKKPAAVALEEAGVEMADMDDAVSLRSAVAGSNAVFAMTNCLAELEVAQGKAMADAAIAAGAELIVWSSLPNVTAMSGGKLARIKNVGTDDQGKLVFSVTWSGRCPLIDIKDAGKFIVPALLSPDEYNGKRFTAATAFYTPAAMVEAWKKVTGKEIKLDEANPGAWGKGFPPDLLEMLKEVTGLIEDYECYGPTGQEDLDWTLAQMDDPPTTWEKFVEENEPWFD
ncbi:MAG: hypothetical protein Q9198_001967 [Flavoplaca austrocitrina]